jgi:hypothetical protein
MFFYTVDVFGLAEKATSVGAETDLTCNSGAMTTSSKNAGQFRIGFKMIDVDARDPRLICFASSQMLFPKMVMQQLYIKTSKQATCVVLLVLVFRSRVKSGVWHHSRKEDRYWNQNNNLILHYVTCHHKPRH